MTENSSSTSAGPTGWDLELFQDASRPLSLWFSTKLDAKQVVREVYESRPLPLRNSMKLAQTIQWLFIGGESHGQTLWLSPEDFCVALACNASLETQRYQRETYTINGQLFCIGVHDLNSVQAYDNPRLIEETKLVPFAYEA